MNDTDSPRSLLVIGNLEIRNKYHSFCVQKQSPLLAWLPDDPPPLAAGQGESGERVSSGYFEGISMVFRGVQGRGGAVN